MLLFHVMPFTKENARDNQKKGVEARGANSEKVQSIVQMFYDVGNKTNNENKTMVNALIESLYSKAIAGDVQAAKVIFTILSKHKHFKSVKQPMKRIILMEDGSTPEEYARKLTETKTDTDTNKLDDGGNKTG